MKAVCVVGRFDTFMEGQRCYKAPSQGTAASVPFPMDKNQRAHHPLHPKNSRHILTAGLWKIWSLKTT